FMWGIIPIFLYPDEITYQVFIAFVIGGMAAGAVSTLSYRLVTITIFLTVSLVPLILRFLSEVDFIHEAMGFMALIFFVLLIVSARRINQYTRQNIVLLLESDQRESELKTNVDALQSFHAITANAELGFDDKIRELLVLGRETFKLDIAIISHIQDDAYIVKYIYGPEGIPEAGTWFEFSETYCVHTYLSNGPTGFHHVSESEIATHPCYQSFKLESYLGSPIFVNHERYGTLNFSSPTPRDKPFSERDYVLIQLFAQWIGNEMARTTSELQLSQFKTTLDKIRDCVFMFDPDSLRFFYVNQGAIEQVGYSYKELLNMTPVDIKPEFTYEQFSKMIEPLISGEKSSIVFETVHQHKNGNRVPVDIFLQYIEPDNESPRFVSLVRDITERKRVENMKSDFVSTVSHELRTPLTSIHGSIALITGGAVGELPKAVMEMLRIAYKNTERLLVLINDILDLQKIESGILQFNFRYIDLFTFLEQAIKANEGFASENKVNLNLVCKHKDIIVFADQARLMQVMNNLISNAAKYSPDNGIIDVDCSYAHNAARVSVTDYGEGIPEEFQKNLFEKFTQADSSDSKKLGGSGLGLSIAKSIIDKHGGNIGFEGTEGKGTTFYFELPISPAKH
ncbi:MAG: ATP-binding protein, partial [Gammaproteobacteria bacterium]